MGAWDLGKEKVENDENHDTSTTSTSPEIATLFEHIDLHTSLTHAGFEELS